MKTPSIIFISIFFAGCAMESSTSKASDDRQDERYSYETESGYSDDKTTRYQYIMDVKSGIVQSRMPLPTSWQLHQDPQSESVYITGPGDIIVNKTETASYAYSHDPFTVQTMQQTGQQIAPVYTLEQIVQQSIQPIAQAQGYHYTKGYPLPDVVSFWERFSAGMPQTGSHRQYYAIATEWQNNQGNSLLMVIVQSITSNGQIIHWTVQTTTMKSPPAQFESATKAFLYGMANMEINPQWQQMMNGRLMGQIQRNEQFWAMKSEESARAHQQRMRAIESFGNTSRSIAKTYSDILDINHSGFLARSDMNSSGHSKTVDMIHERAIIANQETNERYSVQAGSKHYWVNHNGEYFGTDNALYDPRIDNRINDQQWSKFETEY